MTMQLLGLSIYLNSFDGDVVAELNGVPSLPHLGEHVTVIDEDDTPHQGRVIEIQWEFAITREGRLTGASIILDEEAPPGAALLTH
jgi:hypothetical protein